MGLQGRIECVSTLLRMGCVRMFARIDWRDRASVDRRSRMEEVKSRKGIVRNIFEVLRMQPKLSTAGSARPAKGGASCSNPRAAPAPTSEPSAAAPAAAAPTQPQPTATSDRPFADPVLRVHSFYTLPYMTTQAGFSSSPTHRGWPTQMSPTLGLMYELRMFASFPI